MAEAAVAAMKSSLDIVMAAGASSLNFAEFQAVLRRACNGINDRPLGLRACGEEEVLEPVTPNTLLLGRASTTPIPPFTDPENERKLTARIKFIEEVEARFWEIWSHQVLPDLMPRSKWKLPEENLRVGDVCWLTWDSKLSSRYTLCRVLSCETDEGGLVRTVEIERRPKDAREASLPYSSRALQRERVAVQRLVLLVRAPQVPPSAITPSSH